MISLEVDKRASTTTCTVHHSIGIVHLYLLWLVLQFDTESNNRLFYILHMLTLDTYNRVLCIY